MVSKTKIPVTELNVRHFSKSNFQFFFEMLNKEIDGLNVQKAIEEVSPFIKDKSVLEFWSEDYFRFLAGKVQFV
jgi:hypothetical protein